MAQRSWFLGLVVAISACGGRFEDATTTGGSGAGGSSGTGGAVAGGSVGAGGTTGQGGADFSACGAADTCVLEPAGACGPGCEPVQLSEFVAVNTKSVAAYRETLPKLPCVGIRCMAPLPGQANMPNFMADCVQGRCQAFDLRTSPLSECKASSDCYLRGGTSCCSSCGDANMVAVSHQADAQNAFCPGGPTACPAIACAPSSTPMTAICSASGHCAVEVLMAQDAGIAVPY